MENFSVHPNKNHMNIGDTKSILKLLEHGLSNVIFKQNVIFQLQDAENPICYITNTICLKITAEKYILGLKNH